MFNKIFEHNNLNLCYECLAHLFCEIFQQTGHLFPLAFFVSIMTSSDVDFLTIAEDVIHNSAKSTSFNISYKSLCKLIIKLDSKLDPISLVVLLASILMLQISLIFYSVIHFLFNFSFSNDFGNFMNFSR